MHNTFVITAFIFILPLFYMSQTPKEGRYQAAGGAYSFVLNILDNGNLEIVEPNKTSIYKKSGNAYQHTETEYSHYMIRVASPTVLYTFRSNNRTETEFTWIGTGTFIEEGCILAEKYQDMAQDEDDPEVQAYTFCAIAAMAKCNYTEDGVAIYLQGIIITLKQMLVDKSKSPCTDVIPQSLWNAN